MITTHAVTVVLCWKNCFVLAQESKERVKGLWSLPGGMREADENIFETAIREVKEETALTCRPKGLVNIEHEIWENSGEIKKKVDRIRWVVVADHVSGELKTTADSESLQAALFNPDQIKELKLRDDKLPEYINRVINNNYAPIDIYNFKNWTT